jgi:hypothetical protein
VAKHRGLLVKSTGDGVLLDFPSVLNAADVYLGRAETILAERRRIKLATIANRRLQHRLQAA